MTTFLLLAPLATVALLVTLVAARVYFPGTLHRFLCFVRCYKKTP